MDELTHPVSLILSLAKAIPVTVNGSGGHIRLAIEYVEYE